MNSTPHSTTALRFFAGTVLALALSSCDSSPAEVVTIAAPKDLVGATVVLDGQVIGPLEHLSIHGGLYERVMKKLYPGSDDFMDSVAINVGVGPHLSRKGTHTAEVRPLKGAPLTASFSYPFTGDTHQCFIYALGTRLEVSDSCRVPIPPAETPEHR